MTADWKDKLGAMFGVDPTTVIPDEVQEELVSNSIPKNKQTLYVELDRKGRNGKSATIITGFLGADEELKQLAKDLKVACGVGGSTRAGEILIQGDFVKKIMEILQADGYKVKRIGG